MTIEADVEDISQLLTDKLGGQEALDRLTDYMEVLKRERDELKELLLQGLEQRAGWKVRARAVLQRIEGS